MDALSKSAIRALRLFGNEEAQRVFTTVGPEQEYFLIDEQYYFERPDLITTGRTLFGAKPPKGHELDDHYFGSIPERILAFMLDTERELAKLGVPVKTRHNEVAPNQYELAPIFENSNVGSDHQQLTMQILQNVARRYGLVCLLHEKPFAGVNGSGKHNNWSMGTDEGENLLEPGDTPHENLQFLFFCAAVIQAVNKHQGLLRASIASPGQDHRLGANEAPPAIISIFLGAAAGEGVRRDRARRGRRVDARVVPRPRHPGAAAAAAARRRPQPDEPVRVHRQQVRVPRARLEPVARRCPNTVLNTIVAEAIDDLAEELEDALRGRQRRSRRRCARSSSAPTRRTSRSCSTATATRRSGTPRPSSAGCSTCRATPDALPYLIRDETVAVFDNYGVLSEREMHSRYEVFLEQYVTKLNIESETAARSRGRCCCRPPPATWRCCSRPPGSASWQSETFGADRVVHRRDPGARAGQRRRQPSRTTTCSTEARYMHDTVRAGDGGGPRGRRSAREDRRRRPVAAAEVLRDPVHQVAGGEGKLAAGLAAPPLHPGVTLVPLRLITERSAPGDT